MKKCFKFIPAIISFKLIGCFSSIFYLIIAITVKNLRGHM
jgi:hypothetical protein